MTGTSSEQTRWQEKLQSIPQRSEKFVIALTKAIEKNANSFSNKIAQSVETEKGLRQLGPSCIGEMPAEVCEVLQMHNVDDSVFFGTEKEWEAWGSKPTAWPCESADWDTWVWRVERKFGEVWKRLGIYDAIIFSTVRIPCDRSLLAAALCFWSSATNSLELRFGALSPTMIDVAAIVGLSPHGQVVDNVLCNEKYEVQLSLEIQKRGKGRPVANFGTWIRFFSKGKVNQPAKTTDGNGPNDCVGQEETVTRVEHAAFIACWLCKFILCTQSKKVTTDSYRLAEALASDKIQASSRPIALGPYVLAHLYRCLYHIVTEGMNPNVGGPLWLFQLWLQTYFSKFRQPDIEFTPAGILGSQLAPLPLPSHSAEECFEILFRSPVFSEKEFAVCFSRKYPSYIAVNIDRVSLGDEANGQATYLAWKSAISMRDLFWGAMSTRSLKFGVELYSPAYFSRQLGYYQAVPAPIPESSNRYSSFRAIFTDQKTITENNLAYEYNLNLPIRSRVATSQCSAEYEIWWAKHVASRFAQDVEKAKESALARNPWAREKNKTTKGTKRSNSSTKASATNGDQPVPTKCANPKRRRRANKLAKDDSTVSSATHSPSPKHIESQRDQSSDSEEDMVRPKRNRPTNSVQSNIILPVSNEVEDLARNLGDEAYEAMSDGMVETEVNQVVQKNTLENEMDPMTMDTLNRSLYEPVNVNVDLLRTPPPMKDVSSMKVLTDSAQNFSQTLISTSKEVPLLSEKSVSVNEPNDDQPVDEQGFEATFQLAGASATMGPPGERTEEGEVPEVVDPLSALVVFIPQEQLAVVTEVQNPIPIPKRNRPTNPAQSNIILPVSNEVDDLAGNLGDEAYEAMSDGMVDTEVNQVVQKNTLENEMDPLTMDTPNRCPPQVSRNEPVNVNVDLRAPLPMKDASSMKVLTDSAQNFSPTLISTSKEVPVLSEKSVSVNEPNDDQPVDEQGFEATFQLAGTSATMGPPGERTEEGEVPEVVDPLSALVVFIPQEQLAVVTEVQNPIPIPQTLEEIGDRERQEGAPTPIREQPLETPMVPESTVLPSLTADAPSLSNLTLPIEDRLRQLLEPETLLESVEMAKCFLGNLAAVNLEDMAVIEKVREYTSFLQAHVTGDELDTLATLLTKLEALPNSQKSAYEKKMAANQQVTQCRSLEAKASQFRDRLQQRRTSISACEAKLKELEDFKASIEAKIATVQTHRARHNEILAQEITDAEELRHSLVSTKGEVKKTTLEAEDKIVECQRLIVDIVSLARRLQL